MMFHTMASSSTIESWYQKAHSTHALPRSAHQTDPNQVLSLSDTALNNLAGNLTRIKECLQYRYAVIDEDEEDKKGKFKDWSDSKKGVPNPHDARKCDFCRGVHTRAPMNHQSEVSFSDKTRNGVRYNKPKLHLHCPDRSYVLHEIRRLVKLRTGRTIVFHHFWSWYEQEFRNDRGVSIPHAVVGFRGKGPSRRSHPGNG